MSQTNDSMMMLGVICFVLYFAPFFNAASRKHPDKSSIFLLNLFLGWTLIGWVVALVWSASALNKKAPKVADSKSVEFDQLERLGELRDKGVITSDEFESEKRKILSS